MSSPCNRRWYRKALCLGMDTQDFFVHGKRQIEAAKEICADCVVRAECLNAAMLEEIGLGETRTFGIRGGMTAAERAVLRQDQVA